jgi:hypothetical protein
MKESQFEHSRERFEVISTGLDTKARVQTAFLYLDSSF